MIFVESHRIKNFTLGKTERLKSRKIIERLFRQGESFAVFPFRLYYMPVDGIIPHLQAGFGVSTKNCKRAVDRNRIKRLMKEAYRLQNVPLRTELEQQGLRLAVFLIYTGKDLPEQTLVNDKMGILLQRLVKIIHEIRPSST